ncbi:YxeA family protein [Bacillus sp. FSL R12-0069]|uniref:YxeA family protein n=1 Tax=Bacillus sp. FSL R12-0069 TaxID=2975342 RepID=UPI0030FBE719
MKLYIAIFSFLLILSITAVGCKYSPYFGKHLYYVQVTTDGQRHEYDDDGFVERYAYELQGFDEKGTAKMMKFTAQKTLKKGAFLKLYYAKGEGVRTWEEVEKEDIPEKARMKLSLK